MRSDTFILLATQKNASDDEPATEAIYDCSEYYEAEVVVLGDAMGERVEAAQSVQ